VSEGGVRAQRQRRVIICFLFIFCFLTTSTHFKLPSLPISYYMVQTAAPVRVTVTLTAGSDDTGDSVIALGLGGEARQEQNITCPSSGNWATYVPCATSTPLDVPAGVTVLRVVKGRPWLGTVDIALA
jgi:hypothetical protein